MRIVNGTSVRVWVDVVYFDYRYDKMGEIDYSFIPGWYELDNVVPLTTQQRINKMRADELRIHKLKGSYPPPYDLLKYIELVNRQVLLKYIELVNRQVLKPLKCTSKKDPLPEFPEELRELVKVYLGWIPPDPKVSRGPR
jgi:hypothetical protein